MVKVKRNWQYYWEHVVLLHVLSWHGLLLADSSLLCVTELCECTPSVKSLSMTAVSWSLNLSRGRF